LRGRFFFDIAQGNNPVDCVKQLIVFSWSTLDLQLLFLLFLKRLVGVAETSSLSRSLGSSSPSWAKQVATGCLPAAQEFFNFTGPKMLFLFSFVQTPKVQF
jgi:hypothetical protein